MTELTEEEREDVMRAVFRIAPVPYGRDWTGVVAEVERIVAARVTAALAPIEALAAAWDSPATENALAYDYGRWHRAGAVELRAALAAGREQATP